MARHSLEYDPVPSVSPGGLPDARAHVSTSSEMFGGSVGQAQQGLGRAIEQAGAQVFDTAKFYSQVASDDGMNQFIEGTNKLMHGDPNAQTAGPDGKPAPDLGYMALKGAAALGARKGVEEKIDNLVSTIRGGLSPEAQLHFDNSSRRYRAMVAERVGAHADAQANAYYASVNKASSDANIAAITLSPYDDKAVGTATENLIAARVKQAQLQGGTTENINEAVRSAKEDALKARVLTISATDPVGAKKLLEANRETAGPSYASLFEHVRSRADQQQGIAIGNEVFAKTRAGTGYANPNLPIFAQAASSVQGSMSARGLARLVQIESAGKPTAGAGSKHEGLVQASDQWWSRFGQGSKFDPEQAIMAAARATAHDRPILAKALGREPTDGELYLAHQQGPKGAEALLTYPNMPAAAALVAGGAYKSEAVARQAIRGNGGNPDAPASAFTSMWVSKFGGNVAPNAVVEGAPTLRLPAEMSGARAPVETPSLEHPTLGPAPEGPITRGNAYEQIMARTDLSEEAKAHAVSQFDKRYSMQHAADIDAEKAKKEASDTAANTVMQMIGQGQVTPDLINQIYSSPALDWRTKHTLVGIAESASGVESTSAYGPGYADAFRRIMAPAGDPEKIGDLSDLLHMTGPAGELTVSGYNRLKGVLQDSRKNVETSGVNTTKAAMLAYAKQKLVVDEAMSIPGAKPWVDQGGVAIYNSKFIPAFESAYDAWVKKGKDPFDFLTQENIDKLVAPLRSRADIAKAQIQAGLAAGEAPAAQKAPPPPAPENVNEKSWQEVVSAPPHRFTPKTWGDAVAKLVSDHSKEAVQEFDEAFARFKARPAADILKSLGIEGEK